jgi:hypothetical protein
MNSDGGGGGGDGASAPAMADGAGMGMGMATGGTAPFSMTDGSAGRDSGPSSDMPGSGAGGDSTLGVVDGTEDGGNLSHGSDAHQGDHNTSADKINEDALRMVDTLLTNAKKTLSEREKEVSTLKSQLEEAQRREATAQSRLTAAQLGAQNYDPNRAPQDQSTLAAGRGSSAEDIDERIRRTVQSMMPRLSETPRLPEKPKKGTFAASRGGELNIAPQGERITYAMQIMKKYSEECGGGGGSGGGGGGGGGGGSGSGGFGSGFGSVPMTGGMPRRTQPLPVVPAPPSRPAAFNDGKPVTDPKVFFEADKATFAAGRFGGGVKTSRLGVRLQVPEWDRREIAKRRRQNETLDGSDAIRFSAARDTAPGEGAGKPAIDEAHIAQEHSMSETGMIISTHQQAKIDYLLDIIRPSSKV